MKKLLRNLIEKLILFLEDIEDRIAISRTDLSKGEDFEKVVKELKL